MDQPQLEDPLSTKTFLDEAAWTQILGRQPRLLVIEDDRDILQGVMDWFEYDGWKTQGCDNGTTFFEMVEPVLSGSARRCYFDALVTDISMPGINTLAILEGLRRVGCHLPMAVISALPDKKIRRRIGRLGNAEFFGKPFQIPSLHQALRGFVLATQPG